MAKDKEVVGDPRDPENQVDNKWYAQFEKGQLELARAIQQLSAVMPKNTVATITTQEPATIDRRRLTTAAEAKKFDRYIGKDFVRLENGKPVKEERYYTPTHCFPLFMTSNQAEFIYRFNVEIWHWETIQDQRVKKVDTCDHYDAKTFDKNFRQTLANVVQVQEEAAQGA